MERDLRRYLYDVVGRCQTIENFTAELTYKEYLSSELVRLATERAFTVIGEALVCASRLAPDLKLRLAVAGQVIAFRNILVHNYLEIQEELVWEVIREHVPELKRQCRAWLAELGE